MNLDHTSSRWISAAAAIAIVALGGLTLERGHDSALPEGVVELGELQPADPSQLVAVTLPGIVADRHRAKVLDGDALAPIAASAAGVLLK